MMPEFPNIQARLSIFLIIILLKQASEIPVSPSKRAVVRKTFYR
jgi:hypothetical protein